MRLDREAEMRGRLRNPVLNRRFLHQLAEGLVDFHRIQLARVEIEKLFLRELLRIKSGLPGWISPSGSADVELRHSRVARTLLSAKCAPAIGCGKELYLAPLA